MLLENWAASWIPDASTGKFTGCVNGEFSSITIRRDSVKTLFRLTRSIFFGQCATRSIRMCRVQEMHVSNCWRPPRITDSYDHWALIYLAQCYCPLHSAPCFLSRMLLLRYDKLRDCFKVWKKGGGMENRLSEMNESQERWIMRESSTLHLRF